ncbi:capsid protein [Desmodus bat hepatitis E virus]|uniref:Pro-secreted protein ORF2 n=1 Tax=Desmodus bat hepatitis E virus TaxID=3070191 RepID=A0AA49AG99_9VIRU|nr:capsid protein [Bat hepatitis E virus]QTE76058.1 capsid protein [Desmodus bat hepatitis E virus]
MSLGLFILLFLSGVNGGPGVSGPGRGRWRGPRRGRGAPGPQSTPNNTSQTPLTTKVLAPDTKPVPDTDQRGTVLRRQYNLVTSPLSLAVPGATNSILYSAPINPLLPLQDGTNTHIMAAEGSNYAQYRVAAATFRFRPVVPASVGGFSVSMSFWPQSNSIPTSVDMNSITSTDVRVVSQPGMAAELVVPRERLHYRNQGWRSVETANINQDEATSGTIFLVVHGSPINSYTNTPYGGPLGMLDIALVMDFRNLTPGNTNSKVSRIKVTTNHRIARNSRGAILPTPAAARFMYDASLRGVNETGATGGGIVGLILNIADSLLGNLPSTILGLAGGQVMYGKPVVSANGEPTLQLYGSVEQAQLDKPLQVPHDIELGTSTVIAQDYVNNHEDDRPSPAPAPKRPLGTLLTGDAIFLRMPNSEYLNSSPDMGGPVYRCEAAEIINVNTGQRGPVRSVDWTKATLDGESLPRTSSGTPPYVYIPLGGKVSFWEHGKSGRAGYPYQYNNNESGRIFISSEGSGYVYISTYANSLGSSGVDLAAIGVAQHQAASRTVRALAEAEHTAGPNCPVCAPFGLPKCIFAYSVRSPRPEPIYDEVAPDCGLTSNEICP